MTGKLPKSLRIGLWFAAAMWLVGIIGYLTNRNVELLVAVGLMGLIAAVLEMRADT